MRGKPLPLNVIVAAGQRHAARQAASHEDGVVPLDAHGFHRGQLVLQSDTIVHESEDASAMPGYECGASC